MFNYLKITELFRKMMKKLFFGLFVLCLTLVGCTEEEVCQGNVEQKMKTVSISAEMGGTDSRASLDSETGAFTWQLISFNFLV